MDCFSSHTIGEVFSILVFCLTKFTLGQKLPTLKRRLAWINDDIQGQDDRLAAWLSSIKGAKSVVLEVGAGTKLPVLRINTSIIAQELKAHVVRINLNEPTPAENTTVIMQGAGAALVAIASEVRAR